MKTFILISFLLPSLSAVAADDPDYCQGEEACRKGQVPLLKSGVYMARGEGRNCAEAREDALDTFQREFGSMNCGLYIGPTTARCYKTPRGTTSSWARCNPSSLIRKKLFPKYYFPK